MPYFDISTSDYMRISNKIYLLIDEVSAYYNLNKKDLRFSHYISYSRNVLKTNFISKPLGNSISGLTITDSEGYCSIGINSDDYILKQFFTAMHEIIHSKFHSNENNKGVVFANMKEGVKYTDEFIILEEEAEIGASLLMANDEVIEYMLSNQYSFKQISETLNSSKNALYTRLINYFEHNLELEKKEAKRLVRGYRYNSSNELLEAFDYCKETLMEMEREYESYISY